MSTPPTIRQVRVSAWLSKRTKKIDALVLHPKHYRRKGSGLCTPPHCFCKRYRLARPLPLSYTSTYISSSMYSHLSSSLRDYYFFHVSAFEWLTSSDFIIPVVGLSNLFAQISLVFLFITAFAVL